MSRIGKLPIAVPAGVTVNVAGETVTVKGPKGELKRVMPSEMAIKQEGAVLTVSRPSDAKKHRAYHGLTRTLLANMVQGVSKGFEKNLEIVGVGFRVEKAGNNLNLRLGFSHPVEVKPMAGISFAVEGTTKIKVIGINKEDVGFRVEKAGNNLNLRLGFSHPVEVKPMAGISFAVEGTTKIKVIGINKEDVGEQAAEIRALHAPDHYKGKGIRYAGEKVKLKPGKAGKVVGRK